MPNRRNNASASSFDSAVLGDRFNADQSMYDGFSDRAYGQATRTLDPYFNQMRGRFEQNAVNKGLSTGSDAYNASFDQFMRQENDAYNNAAFGAMEYGANRLDADRASYENSRQFDAGLAEGGRQFDTGMIENARQFDTGLAEDSRQFNRSDATQRYNIDTNDATNRYGIRTTANTASDRLAEDSRQFNNNFDLNQMTTMEQLAQNYRDNDFRDANFNASQDQQYFNNLMATMSLAPGGSFQPADVSGAYNNQLQGQQYNNQLNNQMWQGFGEALGSLPEFGTAQDRQGTVNSGFTMPQLTY